MLALPDEFGWRCTTRISRACRAREIAEIICDPGGTVGSRLLLADDADCRQAAGHAADTDV